MQKVEKIYSFVVDNITYDKQKAATVTSGYLPNLDAVLQSGTGICFDYSAVMTAMLRSQRIPHKAGDRIYRIGLPCLAEHIYQGDRMGGRRDLFLTVRRGS